MSRDGLVSFQASVLARRVRLYTVATDALACIQGECEIDQSNHNDQVEHCHYDERCSTVEVDGKFIDIQKEHTSKQSGQRFKT